MLVILITWEAQDHIWKEYQLGIVETTSPSGADLHNIEKNPSQNCAKCPHITELKQKMKKNVQRIVVFPALSRPRTRIRASLFPKSEENIRVNKIPMVCKERWWVIDRLGIRSQTQSSIHPWKNQLQNEHSTEKWKIKRRGLEEDRNLRCCQDYGLNEESGERSSRVEKTHSKELADLRQFVSQFSKLELEIWLSNRNFFHGRVPPPTGRCVQSTSLPRNIFVFIIQICSIFPPCV